MSNLVNINFEEIKITGLRIFLKALSNISIKILCGSPPIIIIGLKFINYSFVINSFIVECWVHS